MTDMGPVGQPNGYVSDAELLAWLEAKSTRQSDALREEMAVSTNRQELIEELTNLKNDIGRANTPEEIDAIEEKMRTLLDSEKYAPYATELGELFNPALDALQHSEPTSDSEDAGELNFGTDGIALGGVTDRITTLTDKLDKIDGLALVQIQQLVSDAKETSQLASNVLAGREQAASSIIGNIRG